MAQRDNRDSDWGTWHAPMGGRPSGRCPVQPSTPLGPDQVNVSLRLPSTSKIIHLPKYSNHVATARGSFETMSAGPDSTAAPETWPPAIYHNAPVLVEHIPERLVDLLSDVVAAVIRRKCIHNPANHVFLVIGPSHALPTEARTAS
jgi:hypothetical protein